MKRNFTIFFTISFFFIMLIFPRAVFRGASEGLILWFDIVLPTLLPFIIMSNLLIHTHAIDWLAKMTEPLFCRIFCVSKYGSFAVLAGFLCGYPMGSKVTSDLLCSGHISRTEGKYLLSFCNNTSPMFIISYVLLQNLKEEHLILPAVVMLMLSPVLLSFIFRKYYASGRMSAFPSLEPDSSSASGDTASAGLIDSCIMNGFETITKVGGYIMLFSILIELASLFPIDNLIVESIFLPSLEITNGIPAIAGSTLPTALKFILCMSLTSFGGWCSVAQTRCMIQETGLSILPYIIQKLITALVTSLLAYFYILFLY